MGKISKNLAVSLTLIIVVSSLSLLTVKPVNAQAVPTPSVPQFTFKLVGNSSYVQNVTVAIIKNNGASYYNFRYKWHDTYEWNYYPFNPNDTYGYNLYGAFSVSVANPASSADYTEIIMNNFLHFSSVQAGLLDIQIQGLFGSYNATPSNNQIFPELGTAYDFVFNGTVSDWSSTQTLQVDGTNLTPSSDTSPIITPTPTVPELSWLVIVPLLLALFSVAVIVRHRKTFDQRK